MKKTSFVYTVYIATTPERVWKALVQGDVTRQYWEHENLSDWRPGSTWEHRAADASRELKLVGRVVESSPPRRLVAYRQISEGWPRVLSSMKSFLETGRPLRTSARPRAKAGA